MLKEEFPEHAGDENVELVMDDFEQTIDRVIERYYLDEFRRESKRTATLWKRFVPLEPPPRNGPSLREQLVDYTADWTVLAVAEETPPAADSASDAVVPETSKANHP